MDYVRSERKLPDGRSVTMSVERYIKEWSAIYKPIENAYGLRLVGFDPGFLFADKEHANSTIDIPVWLAKRMADIAKKGD